MTEDTMNEDAVKEARKRLQSILDSAPNNSSATNFGHSMIGAIRWINKNLT